MPLKNTWVNGETYNASDQNAVADLVNSAEQSANRGQANGYASLDSTGKVPLAQWAYGTLIDGGTPDSNNQIFIDGGTL